MTILHTETDFTTALSRLLSNATLRKIFFLNPEDVITEFSLSTKDQNSLLSLSFDELEIQASTLLNKRLHEVQKMIPATFAYDKLLLSSEFFNYAQNYWPTGYNKHSLDAVHFCQYLKLNKLAFNASELNRLKFLSKQRHFAVYFHKKLQVNDHQHFALQIMYRFKVKQKELQLYFAF